ncbi:MAG: N-acetylmannosamine-6-phosphate 2-epimerase [Clostridia bacterium]
MKMEKQQLLNQIKGGLIVSCQALASEPLHSSFIMSKMALAAKLGGAVGIRSNSVDDIIAIKKEVDLPVIGLIKEVYSDSDVYITPTLKEIDALVATGVDIIATDATIRTRPNGETLDEFFKKVKNKYPNILLMADCSSFEEGKHANELGFDFIGTTMASYTPYTKGRSIPDYEFMSKLVKETNATVIAEGGIWSPEQLKEALATGAFAAVVGTAITRPMDITKRYVDAIK